jgi:hypothetical protein
MTSGWRLTIEGYTNFARFRKSVDGSNWPKSADLRGCTKLSAI